MQPNFLNGFWGLLAFMLAGLAVHILNKIDTARRKPGFTFGSFIILNWIGYTMSLILCTVGLFFLADGIEMMPGVHRWVVSFSIGLSGGSIVRSVLSKPKK